MAELVNTSMDYVEQGRSRIKYWLLAPAARCSNCHTTWKTRNIASFIQLNPSISHTIYIIHYTSARILDLSFRIYSVEKISTHPVPIPNICCTFLPSLIAEIIPQRLTLYSYLHFLKAGRIVSFKSSEYRSFWYQEL